MFEEALELILNVYEKERPDRMDELLCMGVIDELNRIARTIDELTTIAESQK